MKVLKRNGKYEKLSFDKIIYRLKKLSTDKSLGKLSSVDPDVIAQKVVNSIYDGISSSELDEEAARIAIGMTENPEYLNLASRIVVSNLHKNTHECFSEVMEELYNTIDKAGQPSPLVNERLILAVRKYKDELNHTIDFHRDYSFDYFGFKTLEKSYLMRKFDESLGKMKILERPQHMYMRIALGIHYEDLPNVLKTYDLISQGYYTHATPTMFNSGTRMSNLSSCFLLGSEDSIDGIYKTITDCAKISKLAGGIGVHISNIRAKNSIIRGTNGQSDGIIPMLKVYNETARYVNQCITPDGWVYSQSGPKQMKDITTSDHLITIDGTFKKVNEVIKNHVSKEILEIRATNTLFPLKVTREHEIYLIKNQKKITKFSTIKNRLDKKLIQPNFYSASELTEDDLVGFPIPTFEIDNDITDLDFYKFYGLMLGDGYHRNNQYFEFGIHLNDITKKDEQLFIKNYLTKNGVNFWTYQHPGCTKIGWYDKNTIGLTREMLYDENKEKRIFDSFLHLPKHKILKILEGLFKSDGSNLKELYFSNTSLKLIMQMRYLLLRVGVLTSGNVKNNIGESHITKHGREITTKKLAYSLRIPKHPVLEQIIEFKKKGQYLKYFEWNGILWGRIKKINTIDYTGDVYDFNMIDNHNYLTDTGLVHNSGRRKGSFAMYIEPWHADIFDFLEMKKNQGHEDVRARDLFYALWIPDRFMKRVEDDGEWHLMCPDECPGLVDAYGAEFEKLYEKYVSENKFRKVVKAQELWFKILEAQIESGTPYLLYKDAVNEKNNQSNLGTIRSSNLCVAPETMILTDTGYYPIKQLENKEVNIWNGHEWSKTIVCKTGENQELIRVQFSNGSELECTKYHKFYLENEDDDLSNVVDAQNLKAGMQLLNYQLPVVKNGASCCFEKTDVPVNCNLETKLTWLDEVLGSSLGITSTDKQFLNDIKYLLQTLGCQPTIVSSKLVLSETDRVHLNNLREESDSHSLGAVSSVFVENVEFTNRISDTYCFTEEKRGTGIFNGILTGQCAEIVLYSDDKQYAVCNLNSIALPKYVTFNKNGVGSYDHQKLYEVAKYSVLCMNRVIDNNYYPTPETKLSNMKHRPLGIGVQGLHDTFIMMKMPFESQEAKQLNKEIFETIYFACLEGSMEEARVEGTYDTFQGSPLSEGLLQFDHWLKREKLDPTTLFSGRWDWERLRNDIKTHGLRNSMLTCCQPTASTAQILGNTEAIEPIDSCIFKRRVLSGEFVIINKHLVKDLNKLGLWSKDMKDRIILNEGSVQNIPEIPDEIKALYKTVWELSQKALIELSADRAPFIDHTQSLNLFLANPTLKKLTSMHFYAWKKGLKTGIYYLRSKASYSASKFSIDAELEKKVKENKELTIEEQTLLCSLENKDACLMCSG